MFPKFPLIDRKDAIALFKDFLQKEHLRVLLVKGEKMMGKSRILKEYTKISQSKDVRSVFIDLKSKSEEFLLLYEIAQQIDISLFPRFSTAYSKFTNQSTSVNQVNQFFSKINIQDDSAEKLYKYRLLELRSAFLSDLNSFPKDSECLVIIDSFDAATPSVQKWLAEDFLAPISKKPQIKIVVAGTTIPEPATSWEDCSQVYELGSVSKDDCLSFCGEVGIEQDEKIISEFVMFFQGRPGSFVQYAAFYLSSKRDSNS